MTDLCILSGCHLAFPSDLVHIKNIQGIATPVGERHGRVADSLLNATDAPLNGASTINGNSSHETENNAKKNIHHATLLPPIAVCRW